MSEEDKPITCKRSTALTRGFDIFAAFAALLFMSPLIFLIMIAIRLDTPGPVFFSQLRLGLKGSTFRLYKFRKFYSQSAGTAVTLKNDPRMTRVGRFLERSKLDELPQLWNILRGNMSLVGPRPETMDFADCFKGRFLQVLDYRPGLFGPNQTIFRLESELYPRNRDPHEFYRNVLFPIKADMDLAYFSDRSLLMDVRWIIRGVAATLGLSIFSGAKVYNLDAFDEVNGPAQPRIRAFLTK